MLENVGEEEGREVNEEQENLKRQEDGKVSSVPYQRKHLHLVHTDFTGLGVLGKRAKISASLIVY